MAKTHDERGSQESEEAQSRMTFGEHLEELRKRIIRAMLGSIFGVSLCIICYQQILNFVARPYVLACEAHHVDRVFLTLKPAEGFLTVITLAFQVGLIISSPWIIFQLWQFVAAGLYWREKKIVYRYMAPSAMLFLAGVAFFYFIVLPMALNFFMSFAATTGGLNPTPNAIERALHLGPQVPTTSAPATSAAPATATAPAAEPLELPVLMDDPPKPPEGKVFLFVDGRDGKIKKLSHEGTFVVMTSIQGALFSSTWTFDGYLRFVMYTALIFGIAFELPMVMLVLAQIGIVDSKTYRSIRKYAYFAILVGSVIAAPSADLMTLFCLFIPLVGLYELGIIAAAFASRPKE